MQFIEELRWRGLINDLTPETEKMDAGEMVTAYIGFDPTAASLHIGSLVPIMLLVHLQRCGHRPIAVVGGATAMIGDPSGKATERKLLSEADVNHNLEKIKLQLGRFLDFHAEKNPAIIVNNYDWIKEMNVLTFLREVGKHLTINYMLGKGFIKTRLETELSFTEFNYLLIQAYDYFWLHQHHQCTLQMGGSDQWGNITTGIELIRKKTGDTVLGLTCPLLTKSDGSKFGKTEEGNVWLDPEMTSPYKFYQFWLNCSDEDIPKLTRIFSLKNKAEIEALEAEHSKAVQLRLMQKELAKELTIRIHSQQDYAIALEASEILFGKGTTETLARLDEKTFLHVFEGVPQSEISSGELSAGIPLLDLLAEKTNIFPSKGEARKMIQGGGVSINKEKIEDASLVVTGDRLLNKKHLLVQKGKKNYYLVSVV